MATLYVTEQGVQVHQRGQRLIVMRGDDVIEDIPMIKVDRVVLVGRGVSLTTPALYALMKRSADILYLNSRGAYVSRIVGRDHKHSRLRYAQSLAVGSPERAAAAAKSIVRGKVTNQRVLVQRHAEGAGWSKQALSLMDDMLKRVEGTKSLDELRGVEGMAAKGYFDLLRRLLRQPRDGKSWGFGRREYYPPPDPINALLSFGYTLLLNQVIAACAMAGLDPDLGFFHALDFGKPAMALDLEEEFRPIIADTLVLTAVNRPLLSLGDFEAGQARHDDEDEPQNGRVKPIYLKESARNRFLGMFESRLNETIYYPLLGEQTTYRRIIEQQAYAMARVILGEVPDYIPFTVR